MAYPFLKLFTRRTDALSPLRPAGVAPTWLGCPDGQLGNPCFSSWVSLASHHCLRTTYQEVLIYLCFNQMVGSPYSLVGLNQAVPGPRPWVAPSVVRRGQENSLLPCPPPPRPPARTQDGAPWRSAGIETCPRTVENI